MNVFLFRAHSRKPIEFTRSVTMSNLAVSAGAGSIAQQLQIHEPEKVAAPNEQPNEPAKEATSEAAPRPNNVAGLVLVDPYDVIESATEFYESAKKTVQAAPKWVDDYWQTCRGPDASDLDEGDSFRANSKVGGSLEVGVGLETSYEVKCTKKIPDPANPGEFISEYAVTIEASPEVKVALGIVELTDAPGVKVEYKFKNADELAVFQKTLSQSLVLAVGLNTGPTKEESDLLKDRLSSVEVKNSVGVEFDAKIGIKDAVDFGAKPGVKVNQSLKVEFENGQPISLIRTTEISGEAGKFGLSIPLVGSDKGLDLNTKILPGKHTATFETRVPIETTNKLDIATLLMDPLRATQIENAESTLKYTVENDAGPVGTQFELEIKNLSADETGKLVHCIVTADPSELKGMTFDVKSKHSVFTDTGINYGIDLSFKGFGIDASGLAEKRDVTTTEFERKDVEL
jgi:hypothetical protein